MEVKQTSPLNREEILFLLRKHITTLATMVQEGNHVPKAVMLGGGGPENIGGLHRITELVDALYDYPPEER